MKNKTRLAVVLSGSGTTLQNILDRAASGGLPVAVVKVVSSVEGAYGLERANRAGIPAVTVARKSFLDRASFSAAMTAQLETSNSELVAFARFISTWDHHC